MQAMPCWIPGSWPGRFGIVPRPRGDDWLDDEASRWQALGINTVVSLLEPAEVTEFGLQAESERARVHGLTFLAFPIPDYGVPPSRESAMTFARKILDRLPGGQTVVV